MTKLSATDTQVFGISVDSVESHKKFRDQEKLNFPLLSDSDRKVSKLYEAYLAEPDLSSRTTFIIDKRGIIRKIDRKVNAGNHGKDLEGEVVRLCGTPKQ